MHISLLGVPTYSAGTPGNPSPGPALGRRAQLLLCAISLESGPLSAERLAELIWLEAPPPTWRVALRGLVAQLRAGSAEIGGELVDTTPTGYRLAAGVSTDLDLLRASIEESERLLSVGRAQQVLEMLDAGARASGAQLAEGLDAGWIDQHRQQIDDLGVRASELLADAASELGDHARAVAVARRAASAHPLNERAHRCLIRALDAAGDRAGVVAAFERCRSVLGDQLGVDPSGETVAAYLSALSAQAPDPRLSVPHHDTSFVARTSEAQRVTLATTSPGLVTVIGPGGVGKSRLAAEVLHEYAGSDTLRMWISLGTLLHDELVNAEVAGALRINPGADDPTASLVEHLAPLGRAILVLDGCEPVLDGVTQLVTGLLAGAPQLTVLATSRVPLQLPREVLCPVEPWPQVTEPSLEALVGSDAFRLLLERVREQGGTLELDAATAPVINDLLGRCSGVPLALELVAAQITAMAPADLVDHLEEVSKPGSEAVQTMAEATFALLDDNEAHAFRWLGVIEGPATLATVRHVVSRESLPRTRVIRVLRELGARGLVTVDTSGPRWTYALDDDLHRLARTQLRSSGQERAALDRLAEMIEALLPEDPRMPPGPYAAGVTEVMPSIRGLLAAGGDDTADVSRCLSLAFRLHRYWASSNVAEGRFWLDRLVRDSPDDPQAAYGTYALGYLSYWAGDSESAVQELTAAADSLTGIDDSYVARAQIYLGGLLDDLDRGPEAVVLVRRAIESAAPFGRDLQVSAAMGLGSVLSERGDAEAAIYARSAIELCEAGGSTEQLAVSLPIAAMCSWLVGDVEQARAMSRRAFELLGDARRIARVQLLSVACGIALADGDIDSAIRFGREGDADGTDLGIERELPLIRSLLAFAHLAQGDLAEATGRALGALDASGHLDYDFPTALALEAACLVAAVDAPPDVWSPWFAAADGIREGGDRPVPVPLTALLAPLRAASFDLDEAGPSTLAEVRAGATLHLTSDQERARR